MLFGKKKRLGRVSLRMRTKQKRDQGQDRSGEARQEMTLEDLIWE